MGIEILNIEFTADGLVVTYKVTGQKDSDKKKHTIRYVRGKLNPNLDSILIEEIEKLIKKITG